ncbi:DUF1684 domain-containing protein [Brachybacterium fresconis]|uniref:Uncharacterized protein (DUF1684 family) n=1 Tax=Brachybacterium fresconis TaxID=173363 RepID=A0ABS4YPS2_9MICO|nr:DUF1684 domain-containing protein [Brachybacterium fresconis]MBP2410465.1 uncharacterized protein (DUF1684 family) [Brachybacterium fresconis]
MSTAETTDESAWRAFRRHRDESLAAPHGVLSQVALHWIDPAVGQQQLDAVPGRWHLAKNRLVTEFEDAELSLLAADEEVETRVDGGCTTTTVTGTDDVRLARFGDDVQIDVIRRGGRIGLRLLDPASPRRAGFDGVPTFPYDPAAVLRGTWRREPTTVTVGSALPWLTQELPSPGVATLETDDGPVEMVLTGESSILFTDETSGTDSADWRQVTAQLDGEDVRVDLNVALNFPSAFSAWGTCPRPPEGNHLPLAVRAGERRVEPTER